MTAARVSIEVVPERSRPADVQRALDEAITLRDRHRAARETVAAAQAELEQAQDADVTATAERVRAGDAPGAMPAAIAKARAAAEPAERNARAIGLASDAAQSDLAAMIQQHAESWLAALDAESEQARVRAVEALDMFDEARATISATSAAGAWLRSGLVDQRFDRRVGVTSAATVALSSRAVTANGEPLRVDDLIAWAREAIEPTSTQTSAPTIEPATAQA
jgi:hypothetical protein